MIASMPRILTADRILGIALLATCGVLWFVIVPEYARGQDQSLFPRFAIVWIAFFATAITLLPPTRPSGAPTALDGTVPDIEPRRTEADEMEQTVTIVTSNEPLPSVFVVALIWGLYAAAVGVLGFYLATWFMLVASMTYLGIRRPRALIIRPPLTLIVVHVLLERMLQFRLPEAFWQ